MISYFKCCTAEGLRNKMVFVYMLNIADIVFTLLLCRTGAFVEANPFVAMFMGSAAGALIAKSIIPAALFVYLYLRVRNAAEKQRRRANVSVAALLILYSLINISHLTWISILLIRPSLLT